MHVASDDLANECRDSTITIPVSDDPISPTEVNAQILRIKADKACGPDGIALGVIKLLSAHYDPFLLQYMLLHSIQRFPLGQNIWLFLKELT